MVKTPFCTFDLKTGVPCPKCQALIDEGRYSALDFEVARALLKIEEGGLARLREVEFERCLEAGDVLIVVLRGVQVRDRPFIHRLEVELGKEMGDRFRRVKVVERPANLKEFISQLVYPARVTSVNIYWYPDGSSEYMVGVSRGKLPLPKDLIEEVAKKLVGKEVKIVISR